MNVWLNIYTFLDNDNHLIFKIIMLNDLEERRISIYRHCVLFSDGRIKKSFIMQLITNQDRRNSGRISCSLWIVKKNDFLDMKRSEILIPSCISLLNVKSYSNWQISLILNIFDDFSLDLARWWNDNELDRREIASGDA